MKTIISLVIASCVSASAFAAGEVYCGHSKSGGPDAYLELVEGARKDLNKKLKKIDYSTNGTSGPEFVFMPNGKYVSICVTVNRDL